MVNVLTRKEVLEQFGHLTLPFDFFCGKSFAFSGKDIHGKMIMMFIQREILTFLGPESTAKVSTALQFSDDKIHFLIFDTDTTIIYED